jgi:hypothetical protein
MIQSEREKSPHPPEKADEGMIFYESEPDQPMRNSV